MVTNRLGFAFLLLSLLILCKWPTTKFCFKQGCPGLCRNGFAFLVGFDHLGQHWRNLVPSLLALYFSSRYKTSSGKKNLTWHCWLGSRSCQNCWCGKYIILNTSTAQILGILLCIHYAMILYCSTEFLLSFDPNNMWDKFAFQENVQCFDLWKMRAPTEA